MQALIPQKLRILESSVTENEAPQWNQSTTYAVGALVIYEHYIYQALQANTGKVPADNRDISGAPWRTMSITNQWACLDIYRHTKTKATEGQTTLTMSVPFDRPATGFGLLSMEASSVTATIVDTNDSVIWGGETHELLEDTVSLWNYFFDPFRYQEDWAVTGLPPRKGTLVIELYGNRPAIGAIVVGEVVNLGATQYAPRFGFKDYSISTTDDYGNVVYVERKKAKIGSFPVYIPPQDLDYVTRRVRDIGSRPTLWLGDDNIGYQSMIIFGRMREYDPALVAVSKGAATFDIEGFI